MKKLVFGVLHDMQALLRLGRRKVKDMDLVIADNADLIAQIRMHKSNFDKHYKRACSYTLNKG